MPWIARSRPPRGPPGTTISASGHQLSRTTRSKSPPIAVAIMSRPSRHRDSVAAVTSVCAAVAAARRPPASARRAWLRRLRTVPTGTPHTAAICSYDDASLK
jgi:hypothetical protein